jgi:hypothetical protein
VTETHTRYLNLARSSTDYRINSGDMTASNYISHINGIMDAVHAHLKFKLSALRKALSTVMNSVLHHQVIPVEMYSLCFKHIKGTLHYTKQDGQCTVTRETMTV